MNNKNFPQYEKFWVIFDIGNGECFEYGYCRWFRTKTAALAHIRKQKAMKCGVTFSKPYKVQIPWYKHPALLGGKRKLLLSK